MSDLVVIEFPSEEKAEEVRTLLTESAGVDEAILKDYLNKMHMVKKMFPGSKIQN